MWSSTTSRIVDFSGHFLVEKEEKSPIDLREKKKTRECLDRAKRIEQEPVTDSGLCLPSRFDARFMDDSSISRKSQEP